MPSPLEPSPRRTRRACEPCRKKKTKCDGARPVCSFCERLDQRCIYAHHRGPGSAVNRGREDGGPSPARGSSEHRLQRLEQHIEQIYDTLSNINENIHHGARIESTSPINAVDHQGRASATDLTLDTVGATAASFQPDTRRQTCNFHQTTIARAVDVYVSRIHCQPLPLFELLDLSSHVTEWPQYLLQSLVVIASRLSSDLMPGWSASERRENHKESRRQVMIKMAKGTSHLEILQSFCLLILEEIAEQDRRAVWLDVGIATRLAMTENLYLSSDRRNEWARACWSLYALDHIYNSGHTSVRAFPDNFKLPELPQSHALPRARGPGTTPDAQQNRLSAQPLSTVDTNIDACCLSLLSLWGHAMAFLRDVKDNNYSIVWSEHGSYQKVMSRLYQIEVDILNPHKLRKARVDERSSLQLEAERGYWAPWLNMQFLYHAIQATINHPFLHVAKRQREQTMRPPSFLQHTTDEMLLHSSWVTKFIDFCEDRGFVVNDPFIAHLASTVATGYMFFLNNADPKIAGQAQQGFDACYNFIKKSAVIWDHLNDIVRKLDILKRPDSNQSSANDTALARPAQTSLLWDLFDYSSSTSPTNLLNRTTDAAAAVDLNVPTEFLPSLNSINTPRTEQSGNLEIGHTSNIVTHGNFLQQTVPASDTLGDDANIFDPFFTSDVYGLNFGSDLWNELGQL